MRKSQILGLALLLGLSACEPSVSPSPATSGTPTRIVSLVPSATELIYEVGAGDALVGVTVNDSFPEQVRKLPKVGDQTIDPERLIALKPDLVVLDTEFNTGEQKYRRLGLPVLSLRSKRLADIATNLRALGSRLGRAKEGEAAAVRFEKSLAETPRLNLGDQTVFVEIWGSPLMTVGADSLPDDLLKQLGVTNAYADQRGYFQVDPEDVVSRRPTVVILPTTNSKTFSSAEKLLRKAGVKVNVVTVDGALFTNPSTRVLEGLRQIRDRLKQSSR